MSNSKSNKNIFFWTNIILVLLLLLGVALAVFIYDQAIRGFGLDGISSQMFKQASPSQNPAAWYGTFGDFVGGVLNPLFAFLTFLGLLWTIYMQRIELADTREEMARSADAFEQQNFDNTFFNMLNLLSGVVREANWGDRKGVFAFGEVLSDITQIPNEVGFFNEGDEFERLEELQYFKIEDDPYSLEYESMVAYSELTKSAIFTYHYFRIVYNILKYISSTLEERGSNGKEFDSRKYVRIFRAILSENELGVIFYNCLTLRGIKLKELAEKFELFDNLSLSSLRRQETITQFKRSAFGGNEEITRRWDELESEGYCEEPPYVEQRLGR